MPKSICKKFPAEQLFSTIWLTSNFYQKQNVLLKNMRVTAQKTKFSTKDLFRKYSGCGMKKKSFDKDVYAYSTTTLSSVELEHKYVQIFKNDMPI